MTFLEFWGVELKPGQTLSCDPGKEFIIHLSQAALGETKKGSGNTVVSAKVDDNKVVIGTLSAEKNPQFQSDLVFEKEFELSHSSETASVFACGYKVPMSDLHEFDSSKDEGTLLPLKKRGGLKTVKNQVINPIADADDSHSSDSDSSSSDDLSSSDDDLTEDESSSKDDSSEEDDTEEDDSSSEETYTNSEEIATSSEEDSTDEEDKNTPKKLEDGKKRVAETALKTPASDKKAKTETPSGQTTGDDKSVPHIATPHPAKQAGVASGSRDSNSKPKAKSPKSVGTHACKSCSRTFASDFALQSHEKAKHT